MFHFVANTLSVNGDDQGRFQDSTEQVCYVYARFKNFGKSLRGQKPYIIIMLV